MGRHFLLGFFLFLSVGCGKGVNSGPELPPVLQKPQSGDPKKTVGEILQYSTAREAKVQNARIFLVAGGMDNANFAQEIVDQKKIWLNAGFKEEDIVCYYTVPLDQQFEEDRAQYVALASDLKSCFPASPKLLWKDLGEAAQNPKADFLHLYISSHGAEALSIVAQKPELLPDVSDSIYQLLDVLPDMDQFQITMDALSDGKTMNGSARLKTMFENKEPVSDHFFTPRHLRNALAAWEQRPKFVTIQGCHSGGFLNAPGDKWDKDFLSNEPDITVLTASRHDRASFGCNPGTDRTLYGEIYGAALASTARHPLEIDWAKLQESVSATIRAQENAIREQMKPEVAAHFLPSEPQFFSNHGE